MGNTEGHDTMAKPVDHLHQEQTRTLFWVELVCAECSTTTAGGWTSGPVKVKQMKKEAAQAGWSFGGIHAFWTPACRSNYILMNPAD